MGSMFEVVDRHNKGPAIIKVIGIGSGGVNGVNTMIAQKVSGVEFISMNTDVQHLQSSHADIVIELTGPTRGRGAGGDPNKGREAAIQERQRIEECLRGADMAVLATGLGGGTGTGATPVVGEIARSLGILTVAVVTLPFKWEGDKKMRVAMEGLELLKKSVDAYVVIPNDKMMKVAPKGLPMRKALAMVDQVLCDSVAGVVELITRPGYINRDFEDVRAVLQNCGLCIMGTGLGEGADRAEQAIVGALNNPLLEDTPVEGARHILVNIVLGEDGTPEEAEAVMQRVRECLATDGEIKFGLAFDEHMTDRLKVCVIASGMEDIEQVDPRTVASLPTDIARGFPPDSRGMPNYAARPVLSDQEGLDRIRSRSTSVMSSLTQHDNGESELDPLPAYLRIGDRGSQPVNYGATTIGHWTLQGKGNPGKLDI